MDDGIIVALVGQTNVGKSTLFNRLVGGRPALIGDYAGLTRDRRYAPLRRCESIWLVDTAGLSVSAPTAFEQQTQIAIDESHLLLWIIDASCGIQAHDYNLAQRMRRVNKPILLVANKMDTKGATSGGAEGYALGLGKVYEISAQYGHGISELCTAIENSVMSRTPHAHQAHLSPPHGQSAPQVALFGRPNVGKSTFLNYMCGAPRMSVSDIPGTTRDSIAVDCHYNERPYRLVDTAGVRRRARSNGLAEKFSISQTLHTVRHAEAAIVLLDGCEGIVEQDLRLLGEVVRAQCILLIAVNKWDQVRAADKARVGRELERRLAFIDFIKPYMISAQYGHGIKRLMDALNTALDAPPLKTAHLTRLLQQAVMQNPPPLVRGKRIQLRYAHPDGRWRVVVHGGQTDHLPQHYRRYLQNYFRQELALHNVPVRVEFKKTTNPYISENKRYDRG